MQDLESFLSVEVKKEIADRYFGSRKLIEDDSKEYDRRVKEAYRQLESQVGNDLIRLYILLESESLVHDFFRLTGLRDDIFLEPYLLQSKTIRKRLFSGLRFRGLTRRSRFRNCFLDTYCQLRSSTEEYRQLVQQLVNEQLVIEQEIALFQRNNDLGVMMGFLRGLEGDGAGDGDFSGSDHPSQHPYTGRKNEDQPAKGCRNAAAGFSGSAVAQAVQKQTDRVDRQGLPAARRTGHQGICALAGTEVLPGIGSATD